MTLRRPAALLLVLSLTACTGGDDAATAGPPGEEMPVATDAAPMDTTPAGTPALPVGVAEEAEGVAGGSGAIGNRQ